MSFKKEIRSHYKKLQVMKMDEISSAIQSCRTGTRGQLSECLSAIQDINSIMEEVDDMARRADELEDEDDLEDVCSPQDWPTGFVVKAEERIKSKKKKK
jgi:hypothetical protein